MISSFTQTISCSIILFPTSGNHFTAPIVLPKSLRSCYSPGQSSDFIVQGVNSTTQHGSFSDSLHADMSLDGWKHGTLGVAWLIKNGNGERMVKPEMPKWIVDENGWFSDDLWWLLIIHKLILRDAGKCSWLCLKMLGQHDGWVMVELTEWWMSDKWVVNNSDYAKLKDKHEEQGEEKKTVNYNNNNNSSSNNNKKKKNKRKRKTKKTKTNQNRKINEKSQLIRTTKEKQQRKGRRRRGGW